MIDASTLGSADAFGFGNSPSFGEIFRLFPKHQEETKLSRVTQEEQQYIKPLKTKVARTRGVGHLPTSRGH
jgi:ribosomal protein S4E